MRHCRLSQCIRDPEIRTGPPCPVCRQAGGRQLSADFHKTKFQDVKLRETCYPPVLNTDKY